MLAGKAGGVAWFWAKRHTDYVRNFTVDIRGVLVLEVDLRKRGGHKIFLVGAYFPPAGPSISSKEAALERAGHFATTPCSSFSTVALWIGDGGR